MNAPLPFRWDATARVMVPLRPRVTEAAFGDGQVVDLAEHHDRSHASHGHYFACVNEAFRNLPEHLDGQFEDADHLRKWSLIKAGYRDERTMVCSSRAEALRVAAFLRPVDKHAIISVAGSTVVEFTAKSQSMKAMGKVQFQASKDAVLSILSDLLGVTFTDTPSPSQGTRAQPETVGLVKSQRVAVDA